MEKLIKSDHIWYLLATGTPVNHTKIHKINVEIPNTVPGMPVETTQKHYLQ